MSQGAASPAGQGTGYGSVRYRSYVLTVLLVIYVLNFVDRSLLAVVARPLKAELGIGDTAFGLLSGFGFALLYTVVGLPIARLAERHHRVWIMAASLAAWSLMTALCGLSTDIVIGSTTIGAFWMLLTFRVGVGIGEAGCTPPANSLIADYYPPEKRSTALGYYAMGVTIGTALSYLIGGPITDLFDWRTAFVVLGLPGVLVAVLLKLTVREVPRGYSDPPGTERKERASIADAVRELASKPSYWWMTAGATISAFCGYGISNFLSLYIQRTFDVSAGSAAVNFSAPAALSAAVGTFLLGWLAEKLTRRNKAAIAWLAAAGLAVSVPFYLVAFTTETVWLCLAGLMAGGFLKYGYLAAQYTIGQGVASPRVRATSIALLLFVVNLIGYGLGPLFAGIVSDARFGAIVSRSPAQDVTRQMCDAAQEAVNAAGRAADGALSAAETSRVLASLDAPVSEAQFALCNYANANSTEWSMLFISLFYILAAACFAMSARTYARDAAAR
ncbi:spinster family MFS transporter [Parvularcula maris]|uniref:MFS transporter n=1 Tax=Parvularcula maris TaxID=2965077 RepID=A0A9X2RIU6_9PROT|nr:MFS transporter [Parvularcula maris]MCQ8186465.1 MFS transporter [Parvularcula maris]